MTKTLHSRREYHSLKNGRTEIDVHFQVIEDGEDALFDSITMYQTNRRDKFTFKSLEEFDAFVDFAGETLVFATKLLIPQEASDAE